MSSPPVTRARSGAVLNLEAVVEAVVARLTGAGLVAAMAGVAADPAAVPEPKVKPDLEELAVLEEGPSRAQRRLWLEELRTQQVVSARFGPREKE